MTPEPGRHGLPVYMRFAILYPWMPPYLIAEGVDWGHSEHHKADECSDLKACSFLTLILHIS